MTKTKAAKKSPAKADTINIIDLLTEELETRTGIPFARDAWENAAPNEYGVVELGGTVAEQWADGKLIDAIYAVAISIYRDGCGDDILETVHSILEEMDDILMPTWSTGREFLMDIRKTRWTWNLRVIGPIMRTVPAEDETEELETYKSGSPESDETGGQAVGGGD